MTTLEKSAPDLTQTEPMSVENLTYNQQQRFAYLRSVYDDEATILRLIPLIEGRGENSWKKINDKLELIRQGDYKQQQYDDALYDNFKIGDIYSSAGIMTTVGSVRRDNDLPAYISSIKSSCERDFFKLFVVKTITHEVCCEDGDLTASKMKKVFVGYMPLFRLKPED